MGQQCILSFDKRYAMTPETDDFPFTVELSLAPLLAFWQQTVPHELPEYGAVDAQIRQALKQAPELLEPIEDVSIIAKHKALVDVLMTAGTSTPQKEGWKFPHTGRRRLLSTSYLRYAVRSDTALPCNLSILS